MIAFLTLSILMAALAGLFIALPLWRAQAHGVDTAPASPPQRWTAVWLVTAVVFAASGLYVLIGSPQALGPQAEAVAVAAAVATEEAPSPEPAAPGAAPAMTPERIEAMVAGLAQRLQAQPDDAEGWRMLARSYETLKRFPLAVEAYRHLLALKGPDPDLLTDYAVTLGMAQDQTLKGEPEALLNQALKLNPNHIQALALSGSAAFEQRDYRRAVGQWRKILALIPPSDAETRTSIERDIAKAESLAQR